MGLTAVGLTATAVGLTAVGLTATTVGLTAVGLTATAVSGTYSCGTYSCTLLSAGLQEDMLYLQHGRNGDDLLRTVECICMCMGGL